MPGTRRRLVERLREQLRAGDDLSTLARTVYTLLGEHVRFDFACLATTDPTSGVITWASKSRAIDIGDEEFLNLEYGGPDVNQFAELARRTPPVGVLSIDTGGRPETCVRHRSYMQPRFGFTDELRAALLTRATCWGALALYRGVDDPPFTTVDAIEVAEIGQLLAEAIQRSLFRLGRASEARSAGEDVGPAVLIVDEDGRLANLTDAARLAIDELGGFDHGALPAPLLSVVATTRSRAGPFETCSRTSSGRWLSLRAAPLDGGPAAMSDVVITLEPAPRTALSRLALAAHGLTSREEDVALLVLQGVDTQGIAATLHLSPHTVQDHLKVVFTKLGVNSRREMTARLLLD